VQGLPLKNNEMVLAGMLFKDFTSDGNELVITKRDGNLNPLWTRRYGLDVSVFTDPAELFMTNQFLWEADNGDLILLVNGVLPDGAMGNYVTVTRMRATDGSVVWCKTFLPVHLESWGYASGAFQTGNSLVITGYMDMPPGVTPDVPAFFAMRLSWGDGSMQQLKRHRYNVGDFGAWGNTFEQYKGRRIAGGYEIYGDEYEQGFTRDRQFVAVQLDENLDVTGSQSWGIDYTFADQMISRADTAGRFVILNRGGSGNSNTHLGIYNRSTGKNRRRRLNTTTQYIGDWLYEQNGNRVDFKPNGNTTVLLNYVSNGKPVTELMQLVAEDTLAGCTGTEVSAAMEEIPFKLAADPTGWRSVLDGGLKELPVSITDQTQTITQSSVCKSVLTIDAGTLSLGNDTAVCNKDTLVLQATPGLNNYTWPVTYHQQTVNDSTVKVFPNLDTAYIVQATTARGCLVMDTVRINVLDTPRLFLPADTTFCPGSSMLLQPYTTFDSYQWSTGATDAFITVTQPGSYTLTVTDNNGCKGEDASVVTLKDCASWVYIPTGFTPDNNGRNDVFHPIVSGSLASYYFAVYNRWGQCIFASADPQKGWDGTFKNPRQPTGTYTWYCKYRFEGGKYTSEKGTVVLIR